MDSGSAHGPEPSGLTAIGPYRPWHGAAYVGRLVEPPRLARRVLMVFGPNDPPAGAVRHATAQARHALALREPGVLPLLSVEDYDGRVVWVHEYVDGLCLSHVAGEHTGMAMPGRPAAELVARVAEIMAGSGTEGFVHRGPEPIDLLLTASGRVWVAGFAGPFPLGAASPLSERDTEVSLVFRIGVLLAHLISGAPPTAASQPGAHAAQVRRILIRAMARPGPVLPDSYTQAVRTLLAWEPGARPSLSDVPAVLRQAASRAGGQTLVEWASENIEPLRQRLATSGTPAFAPPRRLVQRLEAPVDEPPAPNLQSPRHLEEGMPPVRGPMDESADWFAGHDEEDLPTQHVSFGDVPPKEAAGPSSPPPLPPDPQVVDPTQWVERVGDPDTNPTVPTARGFGVPGASFDSPPVRETLPAFDDEIEDAPTQEAEGFDGIGRTDDQQMPVAVGPPPEAVDRRAPVLPEGFLSRAAPAYEDGELEDSDPLVRPRHGYRWAFALWMGAAAILIAVAIVAIVILAFMPSLLESPSATVEQPMAPAVVQSDRPDPSAPAGDAEPTATETLPEAKAVPTPVAEPEPAGKPPEAASAPPPTPLPSRPEAPSEPPPFQPPVAPPFAEGAPPPVEETPPPPPSPPAADGSFSVVVRAGDPALQLKVRCNSGQYTGVGQVIIADASRGPCVVSTGSHDVGIRRAHMVITGPAQFTCFSGTASTCE